jgi:hypothetical protein
MKIGKLITLLQKEDPEADVYLLVSSYSNDECLVIPVTDVDEINIKEGPEGVTKLANITDPDSMVVVAIT